MTCTKQGHAGGQNCVTCAEHQIFKAAGERRKANGLRLGRFCIQVDKAALISIEEFWQGWCDTLGKGKATDYLIVCMRRGDEALRRAMAEKETKHAAKSA